MIGRAKQAGVLIAALSVAGPGLSSAQAADDDARAFYQGKQIRFVTMGSPGGGYDTYTRTVGAYLERKIGAKVITTNEPAAGGMIAMSRMMNAAPDGLTLLLSGGEGLVTAQLYGLPGVTTTCASRSGWRACPARTRSPWSGRVRRSACLADMQKAAIR